MKVEPKVLLKFQIFLFFNSLDRILEFRLFVSPNFEQDKERISREADRHNGRLERKGESQQIAHKSNRVRPTFNQVVPSGGGGSNPAPAHLSKLVAILIKVLHFL